MSDYTPNLADGKSYYVAGRAQALRQPTGEQDTRPYSHEFDRMIEAVRAEEREKAAQIAEEFSGLTSRKIARLIREQGS